MSAVISYPICSASSITRVRSSSVVTHHETKNAIENETHTRGVHFGRVWCVKGLKLGGARVNPQSLSHFFSYSPFKYPSSYIIYFPGKNLTVVDLEPETEYTIYVAAGNDFGFGNPVKFLVETPTKSLTKEQSGIAIDIYVNRYNTI